MQESEVSVYIGKLVLKRELYVTSGELVQKREDFLFMFRNECKNLENKCR